jgi:hypothetical protein
MEEKSLKDPLLTPGALSKTEGVTWQGHRIWEGSRCQLEGDQRKQNKHNLEGWPQNSVWYPM